jgi:predicted metalloprotease with PDZ domain
LYGRIGPHAILWIMFAFARACAGEISAYLRIPAQTLILLQHFRFLTNGCDNFCNHVGSKRLFAAEYTKERKKMSANNAQVQYQVEIDSKQLEITVTMTLSGEVAQGEIRLEIPTWVPGDYSFAPYARDLFNIEAKSTSSNENLTVERDGYEAFLVKDGQGEVTVTYKAYAYAIDFAEPSGILDSDYAILLGTRYLHCPAHLGTCQVDYAKLPDGWEIHHPSGAQREGDSNCWTYPSFEILLDTPVVFGNFTKLRRRVIDKDIYFVFVDKGVGFESNVERFVDKLALAAEKIHAVFGHFPFEDYTFVMT